MYARIFYTSEYCENGKHWYVINGDTHYRLDQWTKEDAEADYVSEKSTIQRQVDFMEAYGFYD